MITLLSTQTRKSRDQHRHWVFVFFLFAQRRSSANRENEGNMHPKRVLRWWGSRGNWISACVALKIGSRYSRRRKHASLSECYFGLKRVSARLSECVCGWSDAAGAWLDRHCNVRVRIIMCGSNTYILVMRGICAGFWEQAYMSLWRNHTHTPQSHSYSESSERIYTIVYFCDDGCTNTCERIIYYTVAILLITTS